MHTVANMIGVLGYLVTPVKESSKALLSFGREPCEVVVSELDMPQFNVHNVGEVFSIFFAQRWGCYSGYGPCILISVIWQSQ